MNGKNADKSQVIDVLIIIESGTEAEDLVQALRRSSSDFRIELVRNIQGLHTALPDRPWKLILCERESESIHFREALKLTLGLGLDHIPFIILSDEIDTATALASLRAGASDLVFKGDLPSLVRSIGAQIESASSRFKNLATASTLRSDKQKLQLTLTTFAATHEQLVTAERSRALEQMANGIAHDFNNALTKMLGTTVLLKQERPGGGEGLLAQLEKQIEDAANVVRRLCGCYREIPTSVEKVVDIGQVLADAQAQALSEIESAGRSGLAIEILIRDEARAQVWGDGAQLCKALANLVSNSCDALAGRGGTIELIARCRGDTVQVELRDDGPGMTDTVLRRCMEPLYTTKSGESTGLGLSIAEGIVRSFGGTFDLRSAPGKGTSVFLGLRRATAPAAPKQAGTGRHSSDHRNLRVLVVDDEPAITLMVERSLQHFGHRTSSCLNPIEALERFESEDFDLVVSDRSMPEMSGDAFALRLSETYPATRFVMISGYGDLMRASGERPDGVDIVLPKPTSPDMLNEAIRSLFPADDGGLALAR